MKLTAYTVTEGMGIKLRPAERSRQWMDDTNEHFANRCLPLLVANQCGWEILCSHRVTATWTGNNNTDGIHVNHIAGHGTPPASSHFGYGILTFSFPWVFRTEPGWNLMIRGPTNRPKDRIAPLDGVIETDWNESTFTMNWKFTRPGTVSFEIDEPIAMLIPLQRGSLEQFEPDIVPVARNHELKESFDAWSKSRSNFIDDLKVPESAAKDAKWQRDYTKNANQSKLRLKPFVDKS